MTISACLFWALVVLSIPGVLMAVLGAVSTIGLLSMYLHEIKELMRSNRP